MVPGCAFASAGASQTIKPLSDLQVKPRGGDGLTNLRRAPDVFLIWVSSSASDGRGMLCVLPVGTCAGCGAAFGLLRDAASLNPAEQMLEVEFSSLGRDPDTTNLTLLDQLCEGLGVD